MHGRKFFASAGCGLLAAGIGWLLGGIFGSLLARTVAATALTAAAFFLVHRRARTSIVAALVVVAASAGAYALGTHWITPLLAWPAAALGTGIVCAASARRMRAKAILPLCAPVLGGVGFIAGALLVGFLGFTLDAARVFSEILLGGAAGYGLAMGGGMSVLARWLDRESVSRRCVA